MVPLGIPIIIRHPVFGVHKKGHNFDNHPYVYYSLNSLKGVYGGLYRGLLWGLLRGILGVYMCAIV